MLARTVDFANEFDVLTRCAERLFISHVEAGLIGGLGLSAQYYPYLPVGRIRRRLDRIRGCRAPSERGLFLLLGSTAHHTTREGFLWFVKQAQAHGLPEGARVVVVGLQTDTLLPAETDIPGVVFRGWVEQTELDQLMTEARAVLMPQRIGFGALTRLPELSCAGIPSIVSRHPTRSLDLPPGINVVDDDWETWYAAIAHDIESPRKVSAAEYKRWEHAQPRTLRRALDRLNVWSSSAPR